MYNILLASNIQLIANALSVIANETIPEKAALHFAASLNETKTMLGTGKYHMLILDQRLINLKTDDLQSAEDLKTCLDAAPMLKIVVIYNETEGVFLNNMYLMGVIGFLGLAAPLSDIRLCIKNVYEGNIYIENRLLTKLLVTNDNKKNAYKKDYSFNMLSKREKLVATLLIEGKSNNQICAILQLQPSTVSTFKQHVFKKLQVSNLMELEKANSSSY